VNEELARCQTADGFRQLHKMVFVLRNFGPSSAFFYRLILSLRSHLYLSCYLYICTTRAPHLMLSACIGGQPHKTILRMILRMTIIPGQGSERGSRGFSFCHTGALRKSCPIQVSGRGRMIVGSWVDLPLSFAVHRAWGR